MHDSREEWSFRPVGKGADCGHRHVAAALSGDARGTCVFLIVDRCCHRPRLFGHPGATFLGHEPERITRRPPAVAWTGGRSNTPSRVADWIVRKTNHPEHHMWGSPPGGPDHSHPRRLPRPCRICWTCSKASVLTSGGWTTFAGTTHRSMGSTARRRCYRQGGIDRDTLRVRPDT